MRPWCRVVVSLWFAVVACRGPHGNRPDGSVDESPDGSVDGSPDGSVDAPIDASIDAPADAPADAPIDAADVPVTCSALAAPRIKTAGMPSGVAVADVNGDGKRDVLVTVLGLPSGPNVAQRAALDVLLGNGDGSFQPARRIVIDTEANAAPMAPAVADLDGDGDLDVVIALSALGASAVQLVIGDGQGNFTLGSRLAGAFPSSVGVGDLDRDGHIDIITASASATSGVSILFGTGAGSFAAPIALDAAASYDSVVIGDVDRDHIPDVVAAGDSLAVFRGRGDRTFEVPFKTELAGDFSSDVAVGDLNADGIPDIVTAGLMSFEKILVVQTWLGSGTGTFAKRGERSFRPDHPLDQPTPCCFQPPFPGVLALADYDADTQLDVAVTFVYRDAVDFMKGTGTGDLPSAIQFATGREPSALASADVDGDGRFDLIATDLTEHIEVMLSTQNGVFRAPREIRSAGDNLGRPVLLAVGDVDGDGQADFAVGETQTDSPRDIDTIAVLNSARGGGRYFLPSHFGSPFNQDLLLRDIDADGDLDLIATRGDASWDISVFFNLGNGVFGPRIDTPISRSFVDLAIGNLDGDPKLEIVVSTYDGVGSDPPSILVLKLNNDGSGTFSEQSSIADSGVLLHDFNGDGRLDLATFGSTPSINVRLGKGDGTFESPIVSDLAAPIGTVVVGDLNDDGVPDLAGATGTFMDSQTVLLIGNGSGAFVSAGTMPAPPGGLLALANIDNVAPLDVVGHLGVIYRAGNDTRTDEWTMPVIDVHDVSGDGHPDVLGLGFDGGAPRSNAVFLLQSQCR